MIDLMCADGTRLDKKITANQKLSRNETSLRCDIDAMKFVQLSHALILLFIPRSILKLFLLGRRLNCRAF